MNILDLVKSQEGGNRVALIMPGRPALTYHALDEGVLRLAETLNRLGIGRGDRVAIVMENGTEMVLTFLAVSTVAVAVPLNPKYKEEEFTFYFDDTQTTALITLSGSAPLALAAARPNMTIIEAKWGTSGSLEFEAIRGARPARSTELANEDDVAMILHTSGTTSRPKRVPIRHRNMMASAKNIISTYQLRESDTSLCMMPLFHIHGIMASMFSTLASGGTVICPRGFNGLEFWEWVKNYKPTWYSAVPTMHQMLLARAEKNRDIIEKNPFRFIRSSSSSLLPVVLERIEEAFHAPVLEAYSMTEATHQMASNPLPPHTHKAGTVGYGFGVELGIMNDCGEFLGADGVGEIVVRGPNVIDGYENNPEANAASFVNGWFRTGDQGKIDASGYLSLTGRIKELINRGGEKISPVEVDDVLLRHPAVAEAISFAAPSKTYGEEVHAAIVLKSEVSHHELRKHCTDFLSDFKIPAKFHFLEEIPRGATGKLQRLSMAKILNV